MKMAQRNRGERRSLRWKGAPRRSVGLIRRFFHWLTRPFDRPALFRNRKPHREWSFSPPVHEERCTGNFGRCPNPAIDSVTQRIRPNPKNPEWVVERQAMCAEHAYQVHRVLEGRESRRIHLLRKYGVYRR